MRNPEQIKQREREDYDAIAEEFDTRLAAYTARFAKDAIDLLYPQKHDVALDVAGGTGAAGLVLAERIGSEGSVTIVDISPGMLQQAAKNAAGRMLSNVQTRVMDAEHLEFRDRSFDIVICSQGLMYFPDVRNALGEALRVLKPGGRAGFVVWSTPERFPLFSVPAAAFMKRSAPALIRPLLELPLIGAALRNRLLLSKGPHGFSPSRFGVKGKLESELGRAGFQFIRRETKAYPLDFETFDQFWENMIKLVPPYAIQKVRPAVLEEVRAELRDKLANPRNGSVRLYNEAAYVLARKAI